ncbi:MAG: phage portal protein [Planctomycetaceae bacterium]
MPAFRTSNFRSNWKNGLEAVGMFVDDLLEPFAPRMSNKRRAARSQKRIIERREQVVMQAFEAGIQNDKLRGDKWLKSGLSTDSVLDEELTTLRRNSNEIYRTCGFGTAAIENRTNNVVGSGIRPQARVLSNKTIGLDKARATRINRQLEALYEQLSPHVGAGGRQSLWQIQRLAQRSWLRDGEVFVVFSDVARDSKPIPLQVNLVAAERCTTPTDGATVKTTDGGSFKFDNRYKSTRLGIQKDGDDIVGYYFRDQSPGDTENPEETWTFYSVDRVCHLFEQLWVDQTRGLPWLFSVINLFKDFKDFREAVLTSANVAACMTAIVSGPNPEQIKNNTIDENGRVQMEAGSFLFVGDDAEVSNFSPSPPSTNAEVFNHEVLIEMCAALCEPYSWLTGNRKGQSYSSGKLDEIDGRVPVEIQQKTHSDLWLFDLWQRLVQQAVLFTTLVEITPAEWLANQHHFTRHVWLGPGRPLLDASKEGPALIKLIDANLITKASVHARFGEDSDQIFRQRGREIRLERLYGCEPPDQNNVRPSNTAQPLPEDDDDEPLDEDGDEA